MARTPSKEHGFTLIEIAIVVAVIGVLTALAYGSIARQRPRANLASTTAEFHALLHGARLTAMANGRNVVAMVFPTFRNREGGTGRVILYEDGDFDFFSAAAVVNFGGYAPATLSAGVRSQVLEVIDLPPAVQVGPATGMGAGATLVAPLDGIAVDVSCGFCAAGGDRRGAVMFDPRGRAWFYSQNGAPNAVTKGASISFEAPEVTGSRTVVITNATGAVRTFNNG